MGFKANCLPQLFNCCGITFEIVVTPTEIVKGCCVVGSILQTLSISLRGFGILLGVVVIDVAESKVGETEIWLQSNCFAVGLNCFSVADSGFGKRIPIRYVRPRSPRGKTEMC